MLNVGATGSHQVVVTLYENCSNRVDPYFTWEIQRKGSGDSIIFYQDDISGSPINFNKFTITLATSSTSQGLTAGNIYAQPGEWIYRIYEQATQYVLATSSNLVETGILNIGTTFSTINTFNTPNSNVIPVFRG